MASAVCDHCGQHAPLQCARCKVARYCTASCQLAAWGQHRVVCKHLQLQTRENQRQESYRQRTKEIIGAMTPEEFKWKAWLGGRGHGTHVTAANLHLYAPGVSPPAKDPQPSQFTHPSQRLPQLSVSHWHTDDYPAGCGRRFENYAWRQSTEQVELKINLAALAPPSSQEPRFTAQLSPDCVVILAGDTPRLVFDLCQQIYVGSNSDKRGSFWIIENGIMTLYLEKWMSRRVGQCRDAAVTWWPTLSTNNQETPFDTKYPPADYYSFVLETD